MAVTARLYGHYLSAMLGGMTGAEARNIDWLSDSIKLMLCTASYAWSPEVDDFKNDITNEVPATGGYVAGGTALATKTIVYDTVNHILTLDADDVVWAASTISNARFGILYDDTPAAAVDKPLILCVDFGVNQSTAGVDFRVQWNASGIIRETVILPS